MDIGCDACSRRATHHCARCMQANYCSEECQREAWSQGDHARVCAEMSDSYRVSPQGAAGPMWTSGGIKSPVRGWKWVTSS